MSIRLYNTLTRRLDELPPPPGPVRMYFCGPTVYDRAHVGNARPFVVGVWMRDWLRERGYDATLVHNITDINDKIYEAAPGRSAERAAEATQWYLEDTGDLGLEPPDHMPKATEVVPQIVRFIEELIGRDYAYAVDGDVYFRVGKDPGYGRLSGQRPDQVEEQEPNPRKEDPRDFALWKANKPGEDTWWESPWGRGRPGWHIECSVMAEELLGPVFEIHGGGLDLVFPHHENELAQSKALGHDFARIWTHNGMLEFTGEKMAKSVGNVVTLRDAIDEWGKETLLLLFLGAHWRKPMDYSQARLASAQAEWRSFENAFRAIPQRRASAFRQEFEEALDDDFNTPAALAILHEWRRDGHLAELETGLATFGLFPRRPQLEESAGPKVQYLGNRPPDQIFDWALERWDARNARDFATADQRRDDIRAAGYKIDDLPDGYVITRADRERHPVR